MGPIVLLGIHLHVGKKLGRDGSHCTTGGDLERRQFPMCHWGRNCAVGKTLGRGGSHCATRDEFACREVVRQDWVPLYHLGGTREEAGPTVPLGKKL